MRSRLVVLSLLSLGIASIACAAPASASPPETAIQADSVVKGNMFVVDLEVHPAFILALKSPAMVRLTRFDSIGHQLMRVEIGKLPNPATWQASMPRHIDRQASSSGSSSGSRIAFDPSDYVEKSLYNPLPFPLPASDRMHSQRLSSALRAASLIGTLVRQGRRDRS